MSKYTITIDEIAKGTFLRSLTPAQLKESILYLERAEETGYLNSSINYPIFPSSYPFWCDDDDNLTPTEKAAMKAKFEHDFRRHFWFYEIGQETVGRFKQELEDFLYTYMPVYTQLYNSRIKDIEPYFENYDITKMETGENRGSSSSTGSVINSRERTATGGNTAQQNTNQVTSETGTATNENTHKEKQYPLNANALEEIARAEENGSKSSTDNTTLAEQQSKEDTSNITEDETTNGNETRVSNTIDNNRVEGRTHGIMNINKMERVKEFRDLILNLNAQCFNDARKEHLFFELW